MRLGKNACIGGTIKQSSLILATMFSMKGFRKKRQRACAFLLFLFLSLQALVVVPALHELVHPDASNAGDECAVTLFSHGQIDASSAVVPVFCAPERVIISQALPGVIFVSTDIRLLPSRGPPASSVLA